VTEVSIAPPWLQAAYSKLAPVSMSDFAHCEQTKDSMPAAASIMYASPYTRPTGLGESWGGTVLQDANMNVLMLSTQGCLEMRTSMHGCRYMRRAEGQ